MKFKRYQQVFLSHFITPVIRFYSPEASSNHFSGFLGYAYRDILSNTHTDHTFSVSISPTSFPSFLIEIIMYFLVTHHSALQYFNLLYFGNIYFTYVFILGYTELIFLDSTVAFHRM